MTLRILHTPLNIANDAWSMSRGERAIGCSSWVATVRESTYTFPADIDLSSPHLPSLLRQARKGAFAFSALLKYDLICYEYGASILDYPYRHLELLDLRLSRFFPAITAAVFHGSEIRATDEKWCSVYPADTCDSNRAKRRVAAIIRSVDLLYVKTPDLLRLLPHARYLPQALWKLSDSPSTPPRVHGPLRIAHAPSSRAIKGTEHVIRAVDRLRNEGHDIELLLIENMRHEDALRVYRTADVGIDQLLIGWYGVFAIEMMAMGKPVICHINDAYLADAGIKATPIVNADPESLCEVLRALLSNRQELVAIGERSRRFALEHHEATVLAHRLVADALAVRASRRQRRHHTTNL